MNKTLDKAVAQVATLPKADQENIGRGMLSHIEKLRRLRAAIDIGTRQLNAGQGKSLDVNRFIRRMRKSHGAA